MVSAFFYKHSLASKVQNKIFRYRKQVIILPRHHTNRRLCVRRLSVYFGRHTILVQTRHLCLITKKKIIPLGFTVTRIRRAD